MSQQLWTLAIAFGIILALTVPGLIAFYFVEVRTPDSHEKDLDAFCSCGCRPCREDYPHKAARHLAHG